MSRSKETDLHELVACAGFLANGGAFNNILSDAIIRTVMLLMKHWEHK